MYDLIVIYMQRTWGKYCLERVANITLRLQDPAMCVLLATQYILCMYLLYRVHIICTKQYCNLVRSVQRCHFHNHYRYI